MAIALTFKVLFFSNMTDMFGSIPYEEAFTGRELGGTLTPKFNTQKEVYEFMFADLEAANDIYATNPVFSKPEWTECTVATWQHGGSSTTRCTCVC